MTKIGKVIDIPWERDFEWRIEDFSTLSTEDGEWYESPLFHFVNASWNLRIYPNGEKEDESIGYIGLYLMRKCSGPPIRLHYSLSLEKMDEKTEVHTSFVFEEPGIGWGFPKLLKRSEFLESRSELGLPDVLTVICTMKSLESKDDATGVPNGSQNNNNKELPPQQASYTELSNSVNPVVTEERLDDAINVLGNHAEESLFQTLQPAVPLSSSPNNINSLHSNIVQGSSPPVAKNYTGVIPIEMNHAVIEEILDDAINVLRKHAEGSQLQTLQPAVPLGSSPNNINSLHSTIVQGSSPPVVKNYPGVIPIETNPVVIEETLGDVINVLRNHAEESVLQTLEPAVPLDFSTNNINSLRSNIVQGSSPPVVKNYSGVTPIHIPQNGLPESRRTIAGGSNETVPTPQNFGNAEIATCSHCKITSYARSIHEKKFMDKPIRCLGCCNDFKLKDWLEHECQMERAEASEKLSQDLQAMVLSGDHSDAIIKVKKEEFQLHRGILAARNSYFNSMFKKDMKEQNTGTITIEDCEPDIFRIFVNFIYTGKVEKLSLENVCELYEVADKYQERQLKNECLHFMMKIMSEDTFCDFIVLALKYDEKILFEKAVETFLSKPNAIVRSVKWQNFEREYPLQTHELFVKIVDRYVK